MKKRLVTVIIAVILLLTGCIPDNHSRNNGLSDSGADNNSGNTENSGDTSNPSDADNPDNTQNPVGTDNPDNTQNPVGTDNPNNTQNPDDIDNPGNAQEDIAFDYETVKPNEAGKIMILMFHNFIKEYISGDKEFTMTLGQFESLLYKLYNMGYSLISLTDYLNGNIDTPAGRIPLVFTFDDATSGQFSFIEQDGELIVNPYTAVAIMESFYSKYPEFGLEGTFCVNMGNNVFKGAGTLAKRLEYLVSKGFEIGNHTYEHANLSEIKTEDKIKRQIGLNVLKIRELLPGYDVCCFSLPYGGEPEASLREYLYSGEYDSTIYKNSAILLVGWDPAPSPFSRTFAPLALPRVRAPGISPVFGDLDWWLEQLSKGEQYISDGNPDTIAVPSSKREAIRDITGDQMRLVVY